MKPNKDNGVASKNDLRGGRALNPTHATMTAGCKRSGFTRDREHAGALTDLIYEVFHRFSSMMIVKLNILLQRYQMSKLHS